MPDATLSLAALTILDAGPAGQIRAAAEAGFTSVGLRLMPLLPTDARVVGNADAEREIEALLAATSMAVLEIGVFPVKPEMDWPSIEAVCAFSRRIGARQIVCPVEDSDRARRTQNLQRLADRAARHDLSALVEFNPYSGCTSLAEALELVAEAHHPNVALVIDVLHLSRSGGRPDQLAAVDPALLQLVHLCDAPLPPAGPRSIDELRAESRTARLLPGEGALWLDRLIDVLPAHTRLSIEAPSARHAHLPASERARRALEASEQLLRRRSSTNADHHPRR